MTIASPTAATQSCSYTAMPATTATIKPDTSLGGPTTYQRLCQVCSQVENNADACSSMTSCIPMTAEVTATMGHSSVHVGTLTGEALYTSISNALTSLCPPPTQTHTPSQCTESVTLNIPGIDWKDQDAGVRMDDGELKVLVETSSYNDTNILRKSIPEASNVSRALNNTLCRCHDQYSRDLSPGIGARPELCRGLFQS